MAAEIAGHILNVLWKHCAERFVKALYHSPTWYGVDPLEYTKSTSVMDVLADLREWGASPWYAPLKFAMQVLEPFWFFTRELLLKSPVFWIIALLWSGHWIWTDFWAYMRLGRGGTPSTFAGWRRTKILLLIARILRTDVYGSPYLDPMTEPYRGSLFGLPPREGERPTILGLAPQRQGNQRVNPATEAAMVAILERKASENPDRLVMQRSFVEGHLRALRKRFPAGVELAGTPRSANEWGGEICHIHKPDGGSAHIILHPGDAHEVIQAGFGERHPFGCCAEHWIWRFYHHTVRKIRLPLPFNTVLLYAPRNADELAMFERIVDAAIWFNTLSEDGGNSSNSTPAPATPATEPASPTPIHL